MTKQSVDTLWDAMKRAAEQRVRKAHRDLEEAESNLRFAQRESVAANEALDAFEHREPVKP